MYLCASNVRWENGLEGLELAAFITAFSPCPGVSKPNPLDPTTTDRVSTLFTLYRTPNHLLLSLSTYFITFNHSPV